MSNSAEQLIYKAMMLVEQENDPESALDVLTEAINLATVANRQLELIRAKTILGELLVQIEQPGEAVKEFRDVVKAAETFSDDRDLIDQEVASAKEWLTKLAKFDA
jgi:hypothetical protein